MYSVVLMLALSGGADAVEFGRHRGGCNGGAPDGGCVGSAPVVVETGCTGGAGCNGGACHGGHGGLFRGGLFHRNNGCDGGCNGGGCHGGGLFRGGLFHRNRGCGGCDGGVPAGCSGGVPAPVVAPCGGCSASISGGSVSVAQSGMIVTPVAVIPARIGAPVVVNNQAAILVARR